MEKLVLRGIMYGADKVPDSWFDKIPGNYYKPKPPKLEAEQDIMRSRRAGSRSGGSRRYSHDYSRPSPREDVSRNERDSVHHKRKDSLRDRHDDRYEPYDDQYERQEHKERSHRSRNQYPPAYRPRHLQDGEDQRPRSPTDSSRPVSPFTAAAAAAAGIAAAQASHDRKDSKQQQTPSDQYDGYIPYSNIYGKNQSTYPDSNAGSVQPNHQNQVTTSRHNPMSPDPSILGAVDSPRFHDYARRGHNQYYDDRYQDPAHYEPYYEDEEYERTAHTRPRMRRRSFNDSYDSRDVPSDTRRPSNNEASSSIQRVRGKSMSRIKDTFDKSERGLGYGAVGALAGGLVGSEVGKGAVPAAIGAVLGGLGANMFEARERKKESARNQDFARDDDMTARRKRREQERRGRNSHSPV